MSTFFLNGTLEDLLALGLGASVAYVSVVNLPLQRREARDRLRELCDTFVQAPPPTPPHTRVPPFLCVLFFSCEDSQKFA